MSKTIKKSRKLPLKLSPLFSKLAAFKTTFIFYYNIARYTSTVDNKKKKKI